MNTTQYKTERTNRVYILEFSDHGMYAGIYDLAITVKEIYEFVCSEFNIDPNTTDYHQDLHDISEITSYALHMLATENIELLEVERKDTK